MMREYISSKTKFIDFFLLDYFIAILYDTVPQIRDMIDQVPYNNEYCYTLYEAIKNRDEQMIKEALLNASFHKLSYKFPIETSLFRNL